jgi:hypothetical protein
MSATRATSRDLSSEVPAMVQPTDVPAVDAAAAKPKVARARIVAQSKSDTKAPVARAAAGAARHAAPKPGAEATTAAPSLSNRRTTSKSVIALAALADRPSAVAKAGIANLTLPATPKPEKLLKERKAKLVRDSFTMPKLEYLLLDQIKQRGAALGVSVKKSELIRAGIKSLAEMPDANLLAAIKAVPVIKTGRPLKG